MDRQPAVQPVAETYFHSVSAIYSQYQRLYFFIRLRRRLLKSPERLSLYPLRILFQYV